MSNLHFGAVDPTPQYASLVTTKDLLSLTASSDTRNPCAFPFAIDHTTGFSSEKDATSN